MSLPAPVSAVQPAADGGFVAALKDRVVLLDADGVLVSTVAQVQHAHAGIRFNEGKVDPFGRFLVGAMNTTTGEPDAGLYSFALEEPAELLRGGFAVANGFEWSRAGDEMYLTDTAAQTVYRAPYRSGPGGLGELAPYLRGHDSDGLTRDLDGCFWNAVYGTGRVLQWSAEGEVIGAREVPAPNVTSVALGGPALTTLYVGSARENLDESQLRKAPLSGSIFAFDVEVAGPPVHTFGAASFPSPARKD